MLLGIAIGIWQWEIMLNVPEENQDQEETMTQGDIGEPQKARHDNGNGKGIQHERVSAAAMPEEKNTPTGTGGTTAVLSAGVEPAAPDEDTFADCGDEEWNKIFIALSELPDCSADDDDPETDQSREAGTSPSDDPDHDPLQTGSDTGHFMAARQPFRGSLRVKISLIIIIVLLLANQVWLLVRVNRLEKSLAASQDTVSSYQMTIETLRDMVLDLAVRVDMLEQTQN